MIRRVAILFLLFVSTIRAQTPTPTATPDIRRSHLSWVRSGDASRDRPRSGHAGSGSFGLYMPSDGRLQNLTVKCDGAETTTFTVRVNGSPTILSCSTAGHHGCLDWFIAGVSEDYTNYAQGDYVLVDGSPGGTCFVQLTSLAQNSSPHDAILDFGVSNFDVNNDFCIPESPELDGQACASSAVNDAVVFPSNATITNMSVNLDSPCGTGGLSIVAHDVTTNTDIMTVTASGTNSAAFAACASNCTITGGDQFYGRNENGTCGGSINPYTHVWEFGNTGQIIQARVPQWNTAEARYISPLSKADASAATITYCNDADGVAQNLRVRLNGVASQDITVTTCVGPDDTGITCGAPSCVVTAGTSICTNLRGTTGEYANIPKGYVYAARATSPGQNTGTIGVSFEMAFTSVPLAAPGACGVTTPAATWTPTSTATPTNTGTSTPTPTATPTPTSTATSSPTNIVDAAHHAGITWNLSPANSQPNTFSAHPDSPAGIRMDKPGRLENLTIVCGTVTGGATSVRKNNALTSLSCSFASNTGCWDLYRSTGDYVNFSGGDFINISTTVSIITNACTVHLDVINQDGTEHQSIVVWGNLGSVIENDLCLPMYIGSADAACAGITLANSFTLPQTGTVIGYTHSAANPCSGGFFAPGTDFTFSDKTTSTDLFTVRFPCPNTDGSAIGSCSSNCAVTAGDQYNIRVNTTSALSPGTGNSTLEFAGMGEVFTARGNQWLSNNRYIAPQTDWRGTVDNGQVVCAGRAGLAENLYCDLQGAAVNDVDCTVCTGPDPAHLDCNSGTLPHCTIPAGSFRCSDTSHTHPIYQGYVYNARASAPGTSSGTLGVSYEIAPTQGGAQPVSGCGFATPLPTFTTGVQPTATPTPTPTETPVPTATQPPGSPTWTPPPTNTPLPPTPTPLQSGDCCDCIDTPGGGSCFDNAGGDCSSGVIVHGAICTGTHCATYTPTPTQTPTPTPTPFVCCDCGGFCLNALPGQCGLCDEAVLGAVCADFGTHTACIEATPTPYPTPRVRNKPWWFW